MVSFPTPPGNHRSAKVVPNQAISSIWRRVLTAELPYADALPLSSGRLLALAVVSVKCFTALGHCRQFLARLESRSIFCRQIFGARDECFEPHTVDERDRP